MAKDQVEKDGHVSYRELLLNPPMACLLFARILDPIDTTSIYSYMFAQLKWLSPDSTNAQIATQAGLLAASKTAAKVCTGLLWGRLSDKPWGGRRVVLLISLFSSCIARAGYGLSTSFGQAIFWQVFNGAMSSLIGIVRCMVAELETQPRRRSRAILLLPLAGSLGQLVGPLLGGFLISSSTSGDGLLHRYPFLLPNITSAALYGISFLSCFFFVDETLETFDKSKGSALWQLYLRIRAKLRREELNDHKYTAVSGQEQEDIEIRESSIDTEPASPVNSLPKEEAKDLSFWQIWTSEVVCTLSAHFMIAGHISTFGTTWAVFIASPIIREHAASFLRFTGGVGLTPAQIGTLSSIFNILGITLQTTLPRLNDLFGPVRVWRTALFFFPISYVIAPFCALVASRSEGITIWIMPAVTLLLFMVGRTGATPIMSLLINNCIPAPSARGTINVAGTVVGNLSRSIVPVSVMALYGWGYDNNIVLAGFWAMGVLSLLAILASLRVKSQKEAVPASSRDQTQDEERGGNQRHGADSMPST